MAAFGEGCYGERETGPATLRASLAAAFQPRGAAGAELSLKTNKLKSRPPPKKIWAPGQGSSGGRRQSPLCSGPAGPGPRPRRARKWRRGPALRKWRRRRRPRGEAGRDQDPSRRRGPGGSGRGGQSPGLPRSAPGLRGLPRPSASPAAVTGPGTRPPFPRCPRTACRRLAEEPRCRGSPWVPLSVAPGLGDEGHDTLKDYDIFVAALAVLYHPW